MIMTCNANIADVAVFASRWLDKFTCPTQHARNKQDVVIFEQLDMFLHVLCCNYSGIGSRENEQRNIRRRNNKKDNPPKVSGILG